MRVALDARHVGRGLGIATFVSHLADALIELDRDELVWLGDPALAPAGVAATVRADLAPYPALDGPLGRLIARRVGADLVHFTGNTAWGRPGPIPFVLTLHDLIFLRSGLARHSPLQIVGHRYERVMIGRWLRASAVLAVPSETVAREVASRFPSAPEARVVHEGVAAASPTIQPAPAPADATAPYLLAFAGRDPRKRTTEIVEARRALAPLGVRLKLLAAGGLPPGLREELAHELETGAVEVFEHVPRAALWELLSGALALVYPTTQEGFGLPVLEGMAAGTPVLAGLAPVTREVGGDAIVGLDRRDIVGSIVAEVRRLRDDPAYARTVAERGRGRAGEFTWRRTAMGYSDLYREAVEGSRA